MSGQRRQVLLCNCNRTMQLDAAKLGRASDGAALPAPQSELCRRHVAAFEAAVRNGDDLLVACTQEEPLFRELHGEFGGAGRIDFVNIRETAGWGADAAASAPKIAALLTAAALPPAEPVSVVLYHSEGQLLIIGPAEAALQWAETLAGQLQVSVLITRSGGTAALPSQRRYPVFSGSNVGVKGYLGAFEISWEQANPIDLDICTRCGACARACPEQAIDDLYQVDAEKCKSHRACVKVCADIGAIDFARDNRARNERYDLVLDLSAQPLLRQHELPRGYFAPGADPLLQAHAARELERLTGDFEKPKFFAYQARICAHSRAEIKGCTQCIDVCSTGAISADGDHVLVEPHLCMGCGGCATACPSGAMTYAYPRMADSGLKVKTLLAAYQGAGGRDACLLIHDGEAGREQVLRLGRRGKGLPARVIPFEVMHVASVGIDMLLGAVAFGASQVVVAAGGGEAPEYLQLLHAQFDHAQRILTALGYGNGHFRVIDGAAHGALEAALWDSTLAPAAPSAALFNWSNDKRTTLDFALRHLLAKAPQQCESVALGRGAPYGAIVVDKQACTLCMACVGACPAHALLDSQQRPRLQFIERNCVQCGLCMQTCPEDAISLLPRLAFGKGAKEAQTLNEAEAFACVNCGKPFATRQIIENMLGRLSSHPMFGTAAALDRLKMCADCRVIDVFRNEQSGPTGNAK